MENKENLNICAELCKQKDIIQNLCSISSKILEVLRGAMPSENAECVGEKLLKDTFNSALGTEKLSEEKVKKNSNDKKELREFLKGLNEALAKDLKDLEEMLGDEENE